MSTQQDIEQFIETCGVSDNHKQLIRDELTALLLSLQDEQSNKCAEKYMYLNQNNVEPVKIYEAIKTIEYAYNPKPETA